MSAGVYLKPEEVAKRLAEMFAESKGEVHYYAAELEPGRWYFTEDPGTITAAAQRRNLATCIVMSTREVNVGDTMKFRPPARGPGSPVRRPR